MSHRDPNNIRILSMDNDAYVNSDAFFNNADMVQDAQDCGLDVKPVDGRGSYVPTSKDDDSNLREQQETIRKRFFLGK